MTALAPLVLEINRLSPTSFSVNGDPTLKKGKWTVRDVVFDDFCRDS